MLSKASLKAFRLARAVSGTNALHPYAKILKAKPAILSGMIEMPARKKRKYTFRKNQPIPYESGSIIHEEAKSQRRMAKLLGPVFGTRKKRKRVS